jgi:hypothetical protein
VTGPIKFADGLDVLPGLRAEALVKIFFATKAKASLLFDEHVGDKDDLTV